YNNLFGTFIDDAEDEVLGMIAYAIYKRAKREWVINCHVKHGRKPTVDEEDGYVGTWTDTQITSARNMAAQTITAFADSVISQARPDILKDALRGKFWKSVAASVVAAVLYTSILIVLGLILAYSGVDVAGIFERVGQM